MLCFLTLFRFLLFFVPNSVNEEEASSQPSVAMVFEVVGGEEVKRRCTHRQSTILAFFCIVCIILFYRPLRFVPLFRNVCLVFIVYGICFVWSFVVYIVFFLVAISIETPRNTHVFFFRHKSQGAQGSV